MLPIIFHVDTDECFVDEMMKAFRILTGLLQTMSACSEIDLHIQLSQ